MNLDCLGDVAFKLSGKEIKDDNAGFSGFELTGCIDHFRASTKRYNAGDSDWLVASVQQFKPPTKLISLGSLAKTEDAGDYTEIALGCESGCKEANSKKGSHHLKLISSCRACFCSSKAAGDVAGRLRHWVRYSL